MGDHDNVLETALREFKRSVEITRDVRFQANLRLAVRQRVSSYMVSFLSLYVIGLSLIPNILPLQQYQNQILLSSSIILSVFVIFTSLIDGAQNFYHQGELLHQCARKVATVYHKLKNIDPSANAEEAKSQLESLQAEYRTALDDCPINHANVDFIREMARKPHLFPVDYGSDKHGLKRFWYRCYAVVGPHTWMSLHLVAILVVSFVVYRFVLTASTAPMNATG